MKAQLSKNANPRIRPLVKWTGGKYDEFKMFAEYIPAFENYYEPFFGGGGVFFALQPQQKCFVNDKSADLIKFYAQLTNPDFKKEMMLYVSAWEKAGELATHFISLLNAKFILFLDEKLSKEKLKAFIDATFNTLEQKKYKPLFSTAFCLSATSFIKILSASVLDKMSRIKKISAKDGSAFSKADLSDHIATSIKGGLYLYVRKMMNDSFMKRVALPVEKEVANWFFVREFCYASMFRYNARGEFNIPYGGIAYNSKNFAQKVKGLFNANLQNLFLHTKTANEDFEKFLLKNKPSAKDFIFLDPPYDSEFSKYDNNSFTKDDQVRLRNTLQKVKGKWMMVIKETDFIRNLYEEINAKIIYFDKKYTYNVRGRNNRDTKHLIITNYDTTDLTIDTHLHQAK